LPEFSTPPRRSYESALALPLLVIGSAPALPH
jgi:hypothetical protein